MLMQQFLGILQADAFLDGHQIFLGHDFGNRFVHFGLETQVPVGDDPHKTIPLGHRDTGNTVFGHQR